MSAFRILCDDGEFSQENAAGVENAMDGFVETDTPIAVELLFVDGEEIRRLNREMRSIDKVTDVLSFPTLNDIKGRPLKKKEHPFDIDEDGNLLIGSIAICCERAKQQAVEYGHSYERELHYLLVHGIMHCLGYDHMTEEEKREMRAQEEKILEKLGITR